MVQTERHNDLQLMKLSHANQKGQQIDLLKWDDKKALKLFENLFCHKNTQITANHFLLLFPFEINKHKQSAFKSH